MIILKIGGGKEINFSYLAEDLKNLVNEEKFIIVLGANYYRNKLANDLGIEIKIIESASGYKSVYTNQEIIDLILMTYSGLQAKKLTAELIKRKIKAISLSGIDGNLIIANKKNITAKINGKVKLINDSYTGKIKKINKDLIDYFLNNKYIFIISQPAISEEGEILNVDNDQIVLNLAKIYQPEKIIFLIESPGILADKNKEDSLISNLKIDDLEKLTKEIPDYGFQKKIINIKKLTELKIPKIIISDGRKENPIINALNDFGTKIVYE